MSDTDDTEALLVIPPNFFVVDSDSESGTEITVCRRQCVDRVHKTSECYKSLKSIKYNSYNKNSNLDLKPIAVSCNIKVTPVDASHIHRHKCLYNEHFSMSSDISSVMTLPSTNEDRLLIEIDNFLSKTVAGFERDKFTRLPIACDNSGNKQNEYTSWSDVNLVNVKNIQSYESDNFPNKYALDADRKSFKYLDSNCTQSELYKSNYKHSSNELNSVNIGSQHEGWRNEDFDTRCSAICKRGQTENCGDHVLENNAGNIHSQISLDKLWNSESKNDNMERETEKLRREHCEQEIQHLQTKLLESQEKLAIAIQIDKAKDNAINQLKTAWQRLASNFENKDMQISLLKSDIQKERSQLQFEKQNYIKSCETHKEEINNSYELVKSLKNRILSLEKNEEVLKMKIKSQTEANGSQLKTLEQQLEEAIKEKNAVLQKNEELLNLNDELRSKFENAQKTIETIETKCSSLSLEFDNATSECNILREVRDELRNKISLEQEKNNKLELLKRNLNTALDGVKVREGNLLSDVKSLKKQLDVQKKELKTFYQKQVEAVVKEKMIEFQNQLEYAEKCLEAERQKREQTLSEKYNQQFQCIAHQNELEINLLKEKQKEEIQLYRLQLKNASEQICILKEKLSSYHAKRGKIAEQLHKVMENQWHAALQIISSPSDKHFGNELKHNEPTRNTINENIPTSINSSKVINEEPEMDICQRTVMKKSNPVSTPVSCHGVKSEIDLPAYIKQIRQSYSENNPLDWSILTQSTVNLKNYLDDQTEFQGDGQKYPMRNLKPPWK